MIGISTVCNSYTCCEPSTKTFEGLKKTLPNINTLEEGVNVYYKFYTKEDEEKYGILAITIKKIK